MKRVPHYIRNTGRTMRIPRHVVVIDTWHDELENTPTSSRLVLAGIVAYQAEQNEGRWSRWERVECEDSAAFWSWLYSRTLSGRHYWLVGHGITRHWTLIGGWIEMDEGRLRIAEGRTINGERSGSIGLIDSDPPTLIKLRSDAGFSLSVCDLRNYVDKPIADIAAQVGVDLAHADPAVACNARVDAARKYLLHLLKTWHDGDIGSWRPTMGGLAFAAWRHGYVDRAPLVHCEPNTELLERASLYGGEFRAFYAGRVSGPIHMLDVNMLYPWAASTGLHPVELAAPMHRGSMESIVAWRSRLIMAASVTIESPVEPYPIRAGDNVRWAVGRFKAALIGDELLHALDAGHIQAVHSLAAYLPGRPCERFIKLCAANRAKARADGRDIDARIWKSVANSLIGKFAQLSGRWEWCEYRGAHQDWGQWTEVNADTDEVRTYRAIAGIVQVRTEGGESIDSVPSLSASIHARARRRMREMIERAGAASVYYQAADTIHVDDIGLSRLDEYMEQFPGEVGALRIVGTADRVDYRGPNDFTADGVATISGIPEGAERRADGAWVWHEDAGMRSMLSSGPEADTIHHRVRIYARTSRPDRFGADGRYIYESVNEK